MTLLDSLIKLVGVYLYSFVSDISPYEKVNVLSHFCSLLLIWCYNNCTPPFPNHSPLSF
ncbi:hypothetical protein Hanom_Chr06g00546911 [Helianthus anomalus]